MLGRSARDRTSVSGSLSCHVIFSNFLKLFMWKRSSFLAWRSYTVHVSQAYSRVDKTTARYTFSFVASLMPLLSHTDFCRRPNTELALAMRVSTSSSMFTNRERVLPRYVNLSTAFSVSPPVVIAGSTYVLWGAGWCKTSVFLVLIVSPKLLQAVEKLFMFCCMWSFVAALSAQSSTPIYTTYLPTYTPPIYPPMFLPIYQPIYLQLHLPVNAPTYLPMYRPVYIPIHPPIYKHMYHPIYLPVYQPTCAPTYLPTPSVCIHAGRIFICRTT